MNMARRLVKFGEPLLPYGRHVPFAVQRRLIERVAKRLLAVPLAEGAFELLQGRWLRLEVSDLGLSWCLSCQDAQLQVARRNVVDVCIRGQWRDFLLLASRQEDPDTLFFRRRLVIEGDTELGLSVKNLLDGVDPDQMPPKLWRLVQDLGAAVR